jgi:serine/threonine-protein kinase
MGDGAGGTDDTQLAGLLPSATGPSAPLLGGRYRILGLIGAGGMGTVYRARDGELDEEIALKMLGPHLSGQPDMIERFRREVKLARRVTHRNVVRTFDIGDHGETGKFLTMELVDGESLAALRARERALPERRVVEIALQICAGLGAAHAAGVVHRDLKPENVLLARDGRVVITDFGIARAFDAESPNRTPVGTPAYMAPEQVEGAPNIDARADLYALGVILFELFTGAPPWRGPTPIAVAVARLSQPPPDPRVTAPGLSEPLARIVLRLLARQPEARFADADEVARALAAAGPVHDRSVGTASTTPLPSTGLDKNVAVLPFRNSGPPADDYLAEALTDDLIDALSMTHGLRVRARGGVLKYRDAERDPAQVGRELGVHVVVDGSVRRVGDKLRITARLVGVADGFQLWARRFERPASDLLHVVDEEAAAIADALTVARAGLRESPTDPEALDLYLRARHALQRMSIEAVRQALQLYEAALQRAPEDPMILAGYATAKVRAWFFGGSAEDARRAVARAVIAAPDRAEARLALGQVHFQSGDPASAVGELRRAVRLSPSLAEAHEMLGRISLETGRLEPAMRSLQTALSINPQLFGARVELARAKAMLGNWNEAWTVLGELGPETPPAAWSAYLRMSMWSHDDERIHLWERRVREVGHESSTSFGMLRMYRSTEPGPAIAEFERFMRETTFGARFRTFMLQVMTELLCARPSNLAHALARLSETVDSGLIDLAWIERCPMLAPLRAEPAFAALHVRVVERVQPILAALDG